jgi:fatty-acyl-CoA synthase
MSEVVCVGRTIRDTRIEITAPDGRPLGEDAVGEVRIQGPGVFAGYFNDERATADSLVDGWYSTGDLGFLHSGELYLTGRIKDILIVRGHNLMPDEIERIADGATGGGGLTRSAAFSVEIAEPDPGRLLEIDREIRIAVGRALGLPLADLVFLRRGRIPRTTSGKMQRSEVRRQYLEGELEVIERES